MNIIKEFNGEYRWLSNFHPCHVTVDGIPYKSSEAAYQALKTLDNNDRQQFVFLTAAQAKRKGKNVVLRDDWEEAKLDVMNLVLRAKFTQNKDLAHNLAETGNAELIEGNWWGDTYWGVCKGVGLNHLGKLLMKIRQEILSGTFKINQL